MILAAFHSKDPQIKLCESCLTGLLTGGASCCCSALNATSRLLIAAAVATGQCWHWICQRCWHLSLLLLLKRPKLSNSVPTCWCEEPSLLMTATHSKYVWSQPHVTQLDQHISCTCSFMFTLFLSRPWDTSILQVGTSAQQNTVKYRSKTGQSRTE